MREERIRGALVAGHKTDRQTKAERKRYEKNGLAKAQKIEIISRRGKEACASPKEKPKQEEIEEMKIESQTE